jgi:Domain of unknown function (DUF4249)
MRYIPFILLLGVITGCGSFTQEVEVNLPITEPRLVVESYLEPDSVFRVSVSQTVPFFGATGQVPIIQNATVTISYNDTIVPLSYSPLGNPNNRFAFGEYRSAPGQIVPRNYNTRFQLLVTEPTGKRVTGETGLIPPISGIDTLEYVYVNDVDVSLHTYWPDPNPGVENYYRIVYDFGEPDSVLSIERSDRFRSGTSDFTFTPPNFRRAQNLTIRYMHISKAYFDFYQSIERAQRGNTNPFQEPGRIMSNVQGGIGIFTGIGVFRKVVTVPPKP